MSEPKYKRILLKLSGEALSAAGSTYDWDKLGAIAAEVKALTDAKIEVGIVVGAGNIWRGRQGGNMDRVSADRMGMVATVINSMAIAEAIRGAGGKAVVMTAFTVGAFTEPFDSQKAIEYMQEGKVVVIGGGTGSPFFTTDTGAVLRAVELKADAALFAKNIDGVYDADPKTHPEAKKFDRLTYVEMIDRDLKAVDLTAAAMANDNALPIVCFALSDPHNIKRAADGENIGTVLERGN